MEDCPDVSWQSGNGDQEGVDEHFVVGYRVALKILRFLSLLKMKHIFQELKNSNLGAVHKSRNTERGGRGFTKLCKNTPYSCNIG